MVVRPAVDEDWPKAEPLLRAFGGVLGGVAARIGAMARSSSDCLLVADAGGDLTGYVWLQDLGAQMRQAETMRLRGASAIAGDDPELDTLLRLHTETACRRGGALALRPDDLDPDQCLIRLREKGEMVRWQPVSSTLMGCLTEHGRQRHSPPA